MIVSSKVLSMVIAPPGWYAKFLANDGEGHGHTVLERVILWGVVEIKHDTADEPFQEVAALVRDPGFHGLSIPQLYGDLEVCSFEAYVHESELAKGDIEQWLRPTWERDPDRVLARWDENDRPA